MVTPEFPSVSNFNIKHTPIFKTRVITKCDLNHDLIGDDLKSREAAEAASCLGKHIKPTSLVLFP